MSGHHTAAELRRAEAATWGPRPVAERPQRMPLLSFKPMVKGALRGFATIELPIELTIADIPILTSHGKIWAGLPSKPVLDRDGLHVKIDGKPQYASILSWRDRKLSDKFSAAVVALVQADHPATLSEEGAP